MKVFHGETMLSKINRLINDFIKLNGHDPTTIEMTVHEYMKLKAELKAKTGNMYWQLDKTNKILGMEIIVTGENNEV